MLIKIGAAYKLLIIFWLAFAFAFSAKADRYSTVDDEQYDSYGGNPTKAEEAMFDAEAKLEAAENELDTLRDAMVSGRTLKQQQEIERRRNVEISLNVSISAALVIGGDLIKRNVKFCGRTWYGKDYCKTRIVEELVSHSPQRRARLEAELAASDRRLKALSK